MSHLFILKLRQDSKRISFLRTCCHSRFQSHLILNGRIIQDLQLACLHDLLQSIVNTPSELIITASITLSSHIVNYSFGFSKKFFGIKTVTV